MEEFDIEQYKSEFEPQIIYRGEEYYKKGRVEKCYKTNKGFVAKVNGTDEYIVKINMIDDEIFMECTCPCFTNCKHEYATLLAIQNKKFTEINLLPEKVESKYNFPDFIKNIPENELKDFIIELAERDSNFIDFEEDLNERFFKYLPKEDREFYYNKIYNRCLFDIKYDYRVIEDYIEKTGDYIDNKEYEQAFILYSSIVDAVCDSKVKMNTKDKIDLYSKLGIYARITCKKGNSDLRDKIDKWTDKYFQVEFNDDVYLEDFIINIVEILEEYE